jgi:hypothetical protein
VINKRLQLSCFTEEVYILVVYLKYLPLGLILDCTRLKVIKNMELDLNRILAMGDAYFVWL